MDKKIKSNHKKWKEQSHKGIYSQLRNKKTKIKGSSMDDSYDERSYLALISERLKLPNDILVGAPILTANGRNQLCIENYKGIIEYTGDIIKVQTKLGKICIEGSNLNIDYFTNDEMRISGCIFTIRYH